MAEQAEPQTDPQADPKGGSGQQQGGQNGPKGDPDLGAANKRLTEENKSLKEQLGQLQGQMEEFQKKLEGAKTADDIQAAVDAAKKEAQDAQAKSEAEWKKREKALTVQNALIQAGCADTVALMAHVDLSKVEVASDGHISGLDAAKLKESYPYLFAESNVGSKSFSTAATPGGSETKMTKEEIMAVKDPRKRRKLIAENMDLFE